MKLILVNGPPYSGKDTVANHICESFHPDVRHFRFKTILYRAVSMFYGLSYDKVLELCTAGPEIKDVAHPLFKGKSPRQALIHISETVMKPNFGDDIVSNLTAIDITNAADQCDGKFIAVMSDCGFPAEVEQMKNLLGLSRKDVYVIRVERNGCSYEGDSRTYLPDPDLTIFNNSSLGELKAAVYYSVGNFLSE